MVISDSLHSLVWTADPQSVSGNTRLIYQHTYGEPHTWGICNSPNISLYQCLTTGLLSLLAVISLPILSCALRCKPKGYCCPQWRRAAEVCGSAMDLCSFGRHQGETRDREESVRRRERLDSSPNSCPGLEFRGKREVLTYGGLSLGGSLGLAWVDGSHPTTDQEFTEWDQWVSWSWQLTPILSLYQHNWTWPVVSLYNIYYFFQKDLDTFNTLPHLHHILLVCCSYSSWVSSVCVGVHAQPFACLLYVCACEHNSVYVFMWMTECVVYVSESNCTWICVYMCMCVCCKNVCCKSVCESSYLRPPGSVYSDSVCSVCVAVNIWH